MNITRSSRVTRSVWKRAVGAGGAVGMANSRPGNGGAINLRQFPDWDREIAPESHGLATGNIHPEGHLSKNKISLDDKIIAGSAERLHPACHVFVPRSEFSQGKGGEKRTDINLTKQALVAWEGTKPVVATLVSRGLLVP